jgi:YidC/Oxa1 family membrane protein insertase
MGTDFQRTILWIFFGLSLVLLWDRWLVHSGRPSMFGTASAPQVSSGPAPAAPSASPAAPSIPGGDTAVPRASTAPSGRNRPATFGGGSLA